MKKWAAAVAVVVLKVAVIAGPVQVAAASVIVGRVVMGRVDRAQAGVAPVDRVPVDLEAGRVHKGIVRRARVVFAAGIAEIVVEVVEGRFGVRMIVQRRRRCRQLKSRLFPKKRALNRSRAKLN